MEEKDVVRNIMKIRTLNRWTKREIARRLEINEASYGRIESGKVALTYSYLARIASAFNMSVVDILTYPDVYVKKEDAQAEDHDKVKAVLQVELLKEKKDKVLKLIFGEEGFEVLNQK